jgi:hypothetical protein
MKKNSETIVDAQGIEILVGYRYEESPRYYAEPGNPGTLVEAMVYTEIDSVEVVIKGVGLDILPNLSSRQVDYIKSLLNYEE